MLTAHTGKHKAMFCQIRVLVLLLLAAVCCTSPVWSLDIEPLRLNNLSPLTFSSGIPTETSPTVIRNGHWHISLSQDIASIYTTRSTADEQILLDGELYRSTLSARYGVTQHIEIGAELPFITNGGGSLDHPISEWHNFWGLPQGGRDQSPNNQLHYHYTKHGIQLLPTPHSGTRLGDISLLAACSLHESHDATTHTALTLRSQLKLPTGNSSEFSGNGSTSLAILLTGAVNQPTGYGDFGAFASVGNLLSSTGDLLPAQQNNNIIFATLGAGWSPHPETAVRVQLQLTSPFYHQSQLTEVAHATALAGIGAGFRLGANYLLELAIAEDIAVTTAPDVTFHISLSRHF